MGRQIILNLKRFSLFIAFFAFFNFANFFVFSQTETSQMLIPKRIYVGDTAELHYNFHSNVDFFPNEENLSEKSLFLEKLPFESDNEDFTLLKAIIQKNGALYTVILTFSPWKTGKIVFPKFDLFPAVFGEEKSVPFFIEPEPIEVASILPKGEDSVLRGIKGPMLSPGTIYFIYAGIVLLFAILILILYVIIKWQKISKKIKERRTLRHYAKNARDAMRQFKKLEKNSPKINDVAFCLAVQQIFRYYLSVRFGKKMDSLATNEIFSTFNEIYAGMMSDFLQENVSSVVEIFRRADYIRFAHDSLDSKRKPEESFATSLLPDERKNMIENSRTIIKAFEAGNKLKDSEKENVADVASAANSAKTEGGENA